MTSPSLKRFSSVLLGVLVLLACNSEPESTPGPSKASKKPTKPAVPRIPVGECDDGLCNTPPVTKPIAVEQAPTLATWCGTASSVRSVTQPLAEHFKQICTSTAPTEFLVNVLIPNAYTGAGEPQLRLIGDVGTGNGTVSAFFAIAIKLPVSAATHFERVGPRDGSVDTEKGKIQSQGSQPTNSVSVTPVSSNGDPSWVRGWMIDSSSTAKVNFATTIKTSFKYQLDHYKIGNAGFLYTSLLQNSVETVKNYQILNAMFDYNNSGYQILVAKISADDKGQASKVTDAVKNIAANLVKFIHQQSSR